jgi:hypothetical protein
MSQLKYLQEPREKYNFILAMEEGKDGKWTGKVLRFPPPRANVVHPGKLCGTTCTADSEEELKKQLGSMIQQYERGNIGDVVD